MNELKGFSLLTEETIDLGVGKEEDLIDLGDFAATGHPNLVVYFEHPPLQKWEKPDA